MNSIRSKYSLCEIDNYQTILVSGTTTNISGQGYIFAPYIPVMTNTIVIEGDWKYWERQQEIKKRKDKISQIINKINK